MTTAFISGANGYIAQHLVKLLLSKNFKVIGSVRSELKGQHLKILFNSPNFSYVVVPEIVTPGAFDDAIIANPDINVFFHTGSPVLFPTENHRTLVLDPAVKGTKNALEAAHKYGKNITRFVLTSSAAALSFPKDPKATLTEDTWTDMTEEEAISNRYKAYIGSKTFAEKAAWKFIEENKPQFTLTAVHPSYVFGPQAFESEVKDTLNFSAEIINGFLKLNTNDPLPETNGPWYDVRDVAKAHLIAYESDEAVGKRLFLENGHFSPQWVANVLHKNFPELSNVPVGRPGTLEETLKRDPPVDTRKTARILGFQPIDFETSVVDTVRQILDRKQIFEFINS